MAVRDSFDTTPKKPTLLVVALFIFGIICARYAFPPILPVFFTLKIIGKYKTNS